MKRMEIFSRILFLLFFIFQLDIPPPFPTKKTFTPPQRMLPEKFKIKILTKFYLEIQFPSKIISHTFQFYKKIFGKISKKMVTSMVFFLRGGIEKGPFWRGAFRELWGGVIYSWKYCMFWGGHWGPMRGHPAPPPPSKKTPWTDVWIWFLRKTFVTEFLLKF